MQWTNRLAWAALVGAAFLGGCGDSKVAGGTGSDFPQPTARLLDTALQPISAGVWRLWKVVGDSAVATSQVADSAGFGLPASGLWIVEAWKDSLTSGSLAGLSKVSFTDTNCSRSVTYISGQDSSKVGILPCPDLAAPSLATRASKPMGVGVFGSAVGALAPVQTFVLVPGDKPAYRFMVWSVRWDTVKTPAPSTVGVDSVLLTLKEKQISALTGTVNTTLPAGDWYFEGWVAALDSDSGLYDWTYPVTPRWVDSSALRACFKTSTGNCPAHPGAAVWRKEADVFFVETR